MCSPKIYIQYYKGAVTFTIVCQFSQGKTIISIGIQAMRNFIKDFPTQISHRFKLVMSIHCITQQKAACFDDDFFVSCASYITTVLHDFSLMWPQLQETECKFFTLKYTDF